LIILICVLLAGLLVTGGLAICHHHVTVVDAIGFSSIG